MIIRRSFVRKNYSRVSKRPLEPAEGDSGVSKKPKEDADDLVEDSVVIRFFLKFSKETMTNPLKRGIFSI